MFAGLKSELVSGRLLLIYQMPKAGSQTVEATLRQSDCPGQMFRLHFLSRALARTMRKGLRKRSDEAWRREALHQLEVMRRLSSAIRIRKLLRRFGVRVPKLEVITGMREPLGLALSSLFENYYYSFSDQGPAMLERCREDILHPKTLRYLQNWFDLELRRVIGVDIYRAPFPRQKGYAVFENYFARVLVYRFEALAHLPAMLKDFLGLEIPEVLHRNIGSSKAYGQAYEYARQTLRFDASFVKSACNSPMMRHFYSEQERQAFEQQWTEQPACSETREALALTG